MSRIELQHVSKRFDAVAAVDDVSFNAPEGKLLVLLGPSGCGKSTVLRLIAGLEEVSAGQVRIGGRDVTGLPPAQRSIAMVFQSYALFPHLTVAENIVFGLRVRRVPTAERERRLQRAADLLGLTELLHRKPAQLSGGQRQRVALGRAIVAEAPVCLMDEPLSNLDAQLRHEMRSEIRMLQQRLGMTMVYVTHDQTEAMSMADQVILLVKGRIEQTGSPEDLYDRPGSTFAARFIGTPPMNLIELAPDNLALFPALPAGTANLPRSGWVLGIRPEHVRLSDNGGVPAAVETAEYLGADTIVGCRIGKQTVAARLEGRPHLAPGANVRLTWLEHQVHLFDAQSGRRIPADSGETGPG